MKRVDAIFTADWHIRELIPVSRKENYLDQQWSKIEYIKQLQSKYNCPVYMAGDLFHNWKPSPYLLSKFMEVCPKQLYVIYGNHDLPQHNFKLRYKSGIYTLEKAGFLKVLSGVHWKFKPSEKDYVLLKGKRLLLWHTMVYKDKTNYITEVDLPVQSVMKEYSKADVIVTGHNHFSFTCKIGNRLLVNPGSILRQTLTEKDYEPSVYLYSSLSNSVQRHKLPFDKDVFDFSYVGRRKKVQADKFIELLKEDDNDILDFHKLLKRYYNAHKVSKELITLIDSYLTNN